MSQGALERDQNKGQTWIEAQEAQGLIHIRRAGQTMGDKTQVKHVKVITGGKHRVG